MREHDITDETPVAFEEEPWVDVFLDDSVRLDQRRIARDQGQQPCPGPWSAHFVLDFDEPCPWCSACL